MYPRDAALNYEAGLWLQSQGDYEGDIRFTKRALEILPTFAGALNTFRKTVSATFTPCSEGRTVRARNTPKRFRWH
jgi:hypothetical protein